MAHQVYSGEEPANRNPIDKSATKPLDKWLTLVGIAVGLVFYLLPKTPLVVTCCLLLIFLLLIHPIWNLWWIEDALWRRCIACLLLISGLVALGCASWPQATVRNYNAEFLLSGPRMEVLKITRLAKTADRFFFNIDMVNRGKSPAINLRHSGLSMVTDGLATKKQEDNLAELVKKQLIATLPLDLKINNEIEPGDGSPFFSIESEDFNNELADQIYSGRYVLYIMSIWVYRDPSMPPGKIGVTEVCRYYKKRFDMQFFCSDHNRIALGNEDLSDF
jgi:hypothetical protein